MQSSETIGIARNAAKLFIAIYGVEIEFSLSETRTKRDHSGDEFRCRIPMLSSDVEFRFSMRSPSKSLVDEMVPHH